MAGMNWSGDAAGIVATELSKVTGWAAYSDTQYTSGSPFALTANTDTLLPNNAGSVIDTQKPDDIVSLYDGSVITGRNGDGIAITLEAKVVPSSTTNTYFEFWLDIGGSVGALYQRTQSFSKGAGTYNLNASFTGYNLDTWEANGATVYCRSNTNCDIYGVRYVLTRTHKAR